MNIIQAIRNGLQADDFDTLRGEFTQVPSSSKLASPTSRNPIAKAHYAMIRELARMHIPSYSVNATADEHDDVADYLQRLTSMFDIFMQSVGEEVKDNALYPIDMDCFAGKFYGAIDGFALHELKAAAETAREGQDEDADVEYREAEQQELGSSRRSAAQADHEGP